MCFHICPGSSKNKTYIFLTMVTNATLANMQSTSIWHIPFPFPKMHSKCFQIPKPWEWLATTFHKLLIHTWFIIFWTSYLLQLIVLQIIPLIGIILPLIKMQIKLFINSKQTLGWACKFHKLSSNTNFTFFWIGLIPQLIVYSII